jgi:hypothetical protein
VRRSGGMKKLKYISFLLLAVFCFSASAQTSTVFNSTNEPIASAPPDSIPSFFSSIGNYFGHYNTNPTNAIQFASARMTLWTGADYQQGVNVDSVAGVEFRPFTNYPVSIASVTRNAAIAGTVDSEQFDVQYDINHYDTQLSLGVGGGENFLNKTPFVSVYVEVKKALTANTFAGIRAEEDVNISGSGRNVPLVAAIVGIKGM